MNCIDNPSPNGVNAVVGNTPQGVQVDQPVLPTPITWRIQSGTHARLTARLTLYDRVTPCTPSNSIVTFNLAETEFERRLLWQGVWRAGVREQEPVGKGIIQVDIPDQLMARLREGAYGFTVRVASRLMTEQYTAVMGNLMVEYVVGGPQHSIPYTHSELHEYRVLSFIHEHFTGTIYYYTPGGDVRWLTFANGVMRETETWPE
jgi:hypothetical protein